MPIEEVWRDGCHAQHTVCTLVPPLLAAQGSGGAPPAPGAAVTCTLKSGKIRIIAATGEPLNPGKSHPLPGGSHTPSGTETRERDRVTDREEGDRGGEQKIEREREEPHTILLLSTACYY